MSFAKTEILEKVNFMGETRLFNNIRSEDFLAKISKRGSQKGAWSSPYGCRANLGGRTPHPRNNISHARYSYTFKFNVLTFFAYYFPLYFEKRFQTGT